MNFLFTLFQDGGAAIISATTAAFAIAAIGLNVHFGYTGLVNIGQAGFMLLGAYGLAITIEFGGPLWLGVIVGLAAAALFALILGIPTLRLRGDYLAIVTIAAAEIIRIVGGDQSLAPVTGGVAGIAGSRYSGEFIALSPFPKSGLFTIGPWTYPYSAGNSWWLSLVGWAVAALCALVVFLLFRSPWGRTIRGIREDEDAVRSLGKNVYLYKIQSLVLGGVIGALGGMVFALGASVQPDALGRTTTFLLYTTLLLGGAATVLGPVLGSFLYFIFVVWLQDVVTQFVPSSIMNQQQIPEFTYILVGVGLMLLVIFRPQGILGNKKELSFGA
ncbi:branched-chain amino acid ABC transporter permease [Amnibacterium sp.]|uniref:branched-chain amino acid ABC transporter permease n=1 Tax=Amnibacterium sp. TaxID=1872496 RepID=UPI003F7BDAA8